MATSRSFHGIRQRESEVFCVELSASFASVKCGFQGSALMSWAFLCLVVRIKLQSSSMPAAESDGYSVPSADFKFSGYGERPRRLIACDLLVSLAKCRCEEPDNWRVQSACRPFDPVCRLSHPQNHYNTRRGMYRTLEAIRTARSPFPNPSCNDHRSGCNQAKR